MGELPRIKTSKLRYDTTTTFFAAFVPTIEYGQTERAGQALGGFLSFYDSLTLSLLLAIELL